MIAITVPDGLAVGLALLFISTILGLLGWLLVQMYETHAIVTAEMKPNGGGSIKDAVHQLEQGQVALSNQLEELRRATSETFKARDAKFIEIATPYVEEIEVLKRGQDQVLSRLDDLGNQLAGETAKVIHKLDEPETRA